MPPLAERVEQAVAAAVAARNGELEQVVRELARHANAKVTLTVYAGLTGDGREKAVAKLVEGGFGT